jgi:hypothetical protein
MFSTHTGNYRRIDNINNRRRVTGGVFVLSVLLFSASGLPGKAEIKNPWP